jgi:hypothetical protein
MSENKNLQNITNIARDRFANNATETGPYIYGDVRGGPMSMGFTIYTDTSHKFNDGKPRNTSIGGEKISAPVQGIPIACNVLVYEAMLAAGYNVKYATTSTFIGGGAESYSKIDFNDKSNIKAGQVLYFPGHVGIVKEFDPITGKGVFYGAQTSTGPAEAQFQMPVEGIAKDPNISWGNKKGMEVFGVFEPNDSAYDPDGAARVLKSIDEKRAPLLDAMETVRSGANQYADPEVQQKIDTGVIKPGIPTQKSSSNPRNLNVPANGLTSSELAERWDILNSSFDIASTSDDVFQQILAQRAESRDEILKEYLRRANEDGEELPPAIKAALAKLSTNQISPLTHSFTSLTSTQKAGLTKEQLQQFLDAATAAGNST